MTPSVALPDSQKGTLLSLIADYAAEEVGEKGVFFAKLPKGEKIKCRRVTDAEEMESLGRRANKWATDQSTKAVASWPDAWRPYYTDNKALLGKVWLLSQLCLEKDFKNNHLNCLILARRLGPIFNGLLEQINLASTNLLAEEADEFEESGND